MEPGWKNGPREPKYVSADHDIYIDESMPYDFDGFGQTEAEEVDGLPLVAIREFQECRRDGCDEYYSCVLLFTTETLSDSEVMELGLSAGQEELGAYAFNNAERIDDETIEVDGITITAEEAVVEEPSGECYGVPEEPSYEPYDEL